MWYNDNDSNKKISSKIIKDYFNKKADLVFSEKSAVLEENELIKYFKSKDKFSVLDLGCGDGRWSKILMNKIKYYKGVDFSSTFIKNASYNNNSDKIKFINSKVQEYYENYKFDYILIIGVMTYLNDDSIFKLLKNVKKMLKQNGLLIVRNVLINDESINRKFYDRKLSWLEKLLGRQKYQIIRRSTSQDLKFFKDFKLKFKNKINNTNYIYYILTK